MRGRRADWGDDADYYYGDSCLCKIIIRLASPAGILWQIPLGVLLKMRMMLRCWYVWRKRQQDQSRGRCPVPHELLEIVLSLSSRIPVALDRQDAALQLPWSRMGVAAG